MSQLCIENKSFYTVTDVKNLTTLGRDKAYALMKSKGFPAIKLGRTYLVTKENFEAWATGFVFKILTVSPDFRSFHPLSIPS